MTNRIDTLFSRKSEKILSVYFTAGYPNPGDTIPILKSLQNHGVDMAEIGIPFSDPIADGPVIQMSNTSALKNGMNLKILFEQLKDVRRDISIPILLMGYLNPIMQFGFEEFCKSCCMSGIDGIIIADLPFRDYLQEYKHVADSFGLRMIMLITPETSEERIRLIDDYTEGFIYMVSSASTTGARKNFGQREQSYFKRIQNMGLRNHCLTGFGISNHETMETAQEYSAGAIVGSKFLSILTESASPEMAVKELMTNLLYLPEQNT